MSRIPDCRTDEYYNQKYLNEKDASFVRGFDWCLEMAVDNFFDNHYEKGYDDNEFVAHELLQELPDGEKNTYTMQFDFLQREDDERKVETIIDKVRHEILEWVEMARDELITSIIDGMDEEEYNKIKAEVDAKDVDE